VTFTLQHGGPALFEVFEMTGHRLRRISNLVLEPGARTLEWDGRDERGRLLAAGVYSLRLASPREARGAKIVVTR
jgi:hypothetical protein